MIKQIKSHEDIAKAVELLKLFVKETVYRDLYPQHGNEMHLGKMVHSIMSSHYAWLAELDGKAVGILLAVKEQNMWAPSQRQLREIVWYVLPEYRSGSVAGRLFLEYCQTADELLTAGEIQGYFTSTMTSTTDIDLERRGFKKMEQTYLKEH
jgi:hypothetical protein